MLIEYTPKSKQIYLSYRIERREAKRVLCYVDKRLQLTKADFWKLSGEISPSFPCTAGLLSCCGVRPLAFSSAPAVIVPVLDDGVLPPPC